MLIQEYEIMHNYETDYWWYVGLHELIIHFVSRKSRGELMTILDAGCGTGRLLELLSKHEAHGFDFANEAINFCVQRGINSVYKQDINLWKPKKKYDIIVSADVICSTGINNHKKIIQNFYDALKPDGMLILNLPAFEILRRNHDKAVFVGKRFRKNELKKMLVETGFAVDFITYRLPFLFIVIFIEKIFQKITKNSDAESDLKPIPSLINKILLFINRFENKIFALKLPKFFGNSVFAVVTKKQ